MLWEKVQLNRLAPQGNPLKGGSRVVTDSDGPAVFIRLSSVTPYEIARAAFCAGEAAPLSQLNKQETDKKYGHYADRHHQKTADDAIDSGDDKMM
jgi:hypothetical protein